MNSIPLLVMKKNQISNVKIMNLLNFKLMVIILYLHMIYIFALNNHLMIYICIRTIKIDIRPLKLFNILNFIVAG